MLVDNKRNILVYCNNNRKIYWVKWSKLECVHRSQMFHSVSLYFIARIRNRSCLSSHVLLLLLFCAIWYSLETSERNAQHPEKNIFMDFVSFCSFVLFFLIRLNRKLLFFSNLTLGSIWYDTTQQLCRQIHCTAMNSMSAEWE